jgi:hypothetical protein
MYGCPEDKPCHATLVGVSMLTCWLYVAAFPRVFLGESFGVALGKVFAGNIVNAEGLWLALLVGGIVALWIGLRAALSHDDPTDVGRLLGSMALVISCLFAIHYELFLTDKGLWWHASRAAWLSLMAFGATNIWLETRGWFGRRRRADPPIVQEPSRLGLRVRSLQITEWSAGNDPSSPLPEFQPWNAPPAAIGQSEALPQIVYVKQGNNFVPVRLVDAPRVIEHRS